MITSRIHFPTNCCRVLRAVQETRCCSQKNKKCPQRSANPRTTYAFSTHYKWKSRKLNQKARFDSKTSRFHADWNGASSQVLTLSYASCPSWSSCTSAGSLFKGPKCGKWWWQMITSSLQLMADISGWLQEVSASLRALMDVECVCRSSGRDAGQEDCLRRKWQSLFTWLYKLDCKKQKQKQMETSVHINTNVVFQLRNPEETCRDVMRNL